MDKKNLIIGLVLLMAAFLSLQFTAPNPPPPQETARERSGEAEPERVPTPENTDDTVVDGPAEEAPQRISDSIEPIPTTDDAEPSLVRRSKRADEEAALPEEKVTLSNGFIEVTFTNDGGAIEQVALVAEENGKLAYPTEIDGDVPVVFNPSGAQPALGLSRPAGGSANRPGPRLRRFTLEKLDEAQLAISFIRRDPDGVIIRRVYSLQQQGEESEEYIINHKTEFGYQPPAGREDTVVPLSFFVGLGALPPTGGVGAAEALAAGVYDGDEANFFSVTNFFASSGFLGLFGGGPGQEVLLESTPGTRWATVKNQFFAGILTLGTETFGSRLYVDDLLLDPDEFDRRKATGLEASLLIDMGELAPNETRVLEAAFYVGPKEYRRLTALGGEQDEVMQFGWFSWISIPLLLALNGLQWGVGNWGVAIILLTIIVKAILWPLTAVQTRSAKRMQKISGPMKELREKYKDNPQKMQKETMRLFKEHKVNPAAGCLPLLVQMPIFLGLFFMLRTASELRYADFLWIADLSAQDQLFVIGGFPFNLLPILMALSMFFQMRMTPSPSTDNLQRTIFQFMPLVLLIFLYSFASGLVLYWTVSNVLGIFQQWLTNRSKDPVDAVAVKEGDATASAGPGGSGPRGGGGSGGKSSGTKGGGTRSPQRPRSKARK
ncbi:MAG: membrane protein insertase YidC [Opitutales bacterium]